MTTTLSKQLTDQGIKKAVDHADRVHTDWHKKAYDFLKEFIKTNRKFLCEDVRYASQGIVPQPPSLRAWGHIMQMASKEGLIRHAGYSQVKTATSHKANVSVWATV